MRRFDEPADPTPPFLTMEVIEARINASAMAQREAAFKSEQEHQKQQHEIDKKLLLLVGDGVTPDSGSVQRLVSMIEAMRKDQRENAEAASRERAQQSAAIAEMQSKIEPLEQIKKDSTSSKRKLDKMSMIPEVLRGLWKTIIALAAGISTLLVLWHHLYPKSEVHPPQQLQQQTAPQQLQPEKRN